jgi:hypothetical protein
MEHHDKQIPIWFFIGAILAVYGVLITASGILGWINPPAQKIALWELHADVWWGALLVVFGLFYVVRYWPTKEETLTGLK